MIGKGAVSMNITITSRKTSVKDPFRERVEKKLSKLDRFFDDTAEAMVTVTNEGERETVEVTVRAGGMFYRSEKTTGDRVDSLEAVVDSLFKQIVKNKTKLEQRLRESAFDPQYDDSAAPAEDYDVVRTKRFPVKPMTVEEAILQMNMLGHSFFMFRDAQIGEICVVYKRKGDSYGLIEPTDEDDED
jgi:putative sigma-54 modulation protein